MSSGRVAAFVRLLEEGTEVFRPVEVEMLGFDRFRVVGTQTDDEIWEFAPGAIVGLVDRTVSTGQNIKLIVADGQGRSA